MATYRLAPVINHKTVLVFANLSREIRVVQCGGKPLYIVLQYRVDPITDALVIDGEAYHTVSLSAAKRLCVKLMRGDDV